MSSDKTYINHHLWSPLCFSFVSYRPDVRAYYIEFHGILKEYRVNVCQKNFKIMPYSEFINKQAECLRIWEQTAGYWNARYKKPRSYTIMFPWVCLVSTVIWVSSKYTYLRARLASTSKYSSLLIFQEKNTIRISHSKGHGCWRCRAPAATILVKFDAGPARYEFIHLFKSRGYSLAGPRNAELCALAILARGIY